MKTTNKASYLDRSKNNKIASLGDGNNSVPYEPRKVIDFMKKNKEAASRLILQNVRADHKSAWN